MSAQLPIRMVARPWGCDTLPAPFASPAGERIGEVWFEPAAELNELLVKYIFTSEQLSVQVHPSDAQVPGQGKDECWLILAAEPHARLGIGFRQPASVQAVRQAALDGSIERLLAWFPVKPGDFFYIPAGTVHAIGAGINLIELQQNSKTTYRLYDYARARELHLDEGLAVANIGIHPAHLRRHVSAGSAVLVDGPHFRLERIEGVPDSAVLARFGKAPVLVLPLLGTAHIAHEAILPGDCGQAPSLDTVTISGTALVAQPCGLDRKGFGRQLSAFVKES